jgi:hypothetical protein
VGSYPNGNERGQPSVKIGVVRLELLLPTEKRASPRTVAFKNIEELENKKLAAIQDMKQKSQLVREYIVPNMTQKEVKDILGGPLPLSAPSD